MSNSFLIWKSYAGFCLDSHYGDEMLMETYGATTMRYTSIWTGFSILKLKNYEFILLNSLSLSLTLFNNVQMPEAKHNSIFLYEKKNLFYKNEVEKPLNNSEN